MPTPEWLAGQFEQHRTHLRAVAYRMLGSASEADDAVQESWIRLGRTWRREPARPADDRRRAGVPGTCCGRGQDPLDEHATHVPDPVITRADEDPESDAMLADSVGLALLVVLETVEPAERLAFVLHDVFGMTFDEIAPIVDRSVVATRQLASRARRRVQSQTPTSEADLRKQRRVVDAFLAAAQHGDFEALLAVLDPA